MNALCSGIRSCNQTTIDGDATCTNTDACNYSTIKGHAVCEGSGTCSSTNITMTASCSGDYACKFSTLQNGLSTCTGYYTCSWIKMGANAIFSGTKSCYSSSVSGDATCVGSVSCIGTLILGTRYTEMQELTDEATDIPTMEPTPNPRRYYVVQGNQKAKCRETVDPTCKTRVADMEERHAVRCCSDKKKNPGKWAMRTQRGCTAWAQSNICTKQANNVCYETG